MLHLSDEFSSFSRSERALRHGNTETEGLSSSPLELLSKPKKSNECDGDNERPNVQVLVTPLRVAVSLSRGNYLIGSRHRAPIKCEV